jgi:hypothetical protein
MSNSIDGFSRSNNNMGALVNVQDDNLVAYRKQRKHVTKMINDSDKINNLEKELGDIKSEMSEIKQLLLKVINK